MFVKWCEQSSQKGHQTQNYNFGEMWIVHIKRPAHMRAKVYIRSIICKSCLLYRSDTEMLSGKIDLVMTMAQNMSFSCSHLYWPSDFHIHRGKKTAIQSDLYTNYPNWI